MTAQCRRLFLALCVLATATMAQAGDVLFWGVPYSYRTVHTDRQIPYFAEFPPVYYSYPIPRTYGYSPYAYLPTVMTPDVECAVEPLTIENPYVQPATETKTAPADNQTTSLSPAPQVIDNPYVTQAASLAKLPAER